MENGYQIKQLELALAFQTFFEIMDPAKYNILGMNEIVQRLNVLMYHVKN
jgi:hypothetical protein